MPRSTLKMRTYNLSVPEQVYEEIERIAERRCETVVDVIRRFIRLGITVDRAEEDGNSCLVLKDGGQERQIMLL